MNEFYSSFITLPKVVPVVLAHIGATNNPKIPIDNYKIEKEKR